MVSSLRSIDARLPRRCRAGFTLLELITALAVLGVASTIFIRLYTSSQQLAKASRTHEVAAAIAQEYLTLIEVHPELFVWPNYAEHPNGASLDIRPRENSPVEGNFVDTPTAMPIARRAYERERALYTDYTWAATARLPKPDAQYVEVTVEITWTLQGRLRRFLLTSTVPRPLAEGVGL